MDITALGDGVAAAAGAITGLRAFGYLPDAISPPTFFVAEVEVEYDATFGRGLDTVYLTCRLLVSHTSDRTGQKQVASYMKGAGPTSVKAAIEAERTLGGACQDLRVQRVSGYGLYEHNGTQYYGAEWRVMIIGEGD